MRYCSAVVIAALTSLLAGCHLFAPVNLPPMQSYGLTSTAVPAATSPRTTKTIIVNLPIADAEFDSDKMIYEMTPYNLRHYADHQWIALPSYMLTPILANALRAQGYFKAVVSAPFAGVSDYFLDTRLISLKQSFLQPVSQEIVVLQETLENGVNNQAVASRQFSIRISAPGNNAYAGVVAANKAVNLLSRQIAVWVVAGAK